MRTLFILTILMVATSVLAIDLNITAPAKPIYSGPAHVVDPAVQRQGGDTIADAVPISLPCEISGSTTGYANDYDEVCPYDGSTAPDVVYTATPAADMEWTIDLFGSAFDTKLYVYDVDLNLVACNDDYYPDYTSRLTSVPLAAGMQYYIVIDGYGDSFGDYVMYITDFIHVVIECPSGAELEGEPPLEDGYVDEYNQGCQGGDEDDFQALESPLFCGRSGYYIGEGGGSTRDGDYFQLTIGSQGFIEIVGDAEERTFLMEFGPTNCDDMAVLQNVLVGPSDEGVLTFVGEPGSVVWLFVAPQTYWDGYTYEYTYVLHIDNGVTAIENRSLTEIKSLFHSN